MKKKILYIVESFGGGVFTYLENLTNELVNDFDIYIAYGVRKQTPSDVNKYFDKRVHLIRVKNFTRAISPVKDLKAFFEIKTIKNNINPDIIHLHSSKAGVLGRWAFNGKDTPIFYTPHGFSFLMKDYNNFERSIFLSIEKLSALRKSTIVCVSKGEATEAEKVSKHVTYINTGINVKNIDKIIGNQSFKQKNNDEVTVFTLGRITYPKNPRLFNQLALSMPDTTFVWVGDGELRNELTAPNIKITGWKSQSEAVLEANKYDIFILPSIWEGLPLSLLEAMYMKKLCIVSDFVGNLGVIVNKKNGYVCTTLSEYIRAISSYKSDGTDKILKEAYEDIMKEFTTKTMARSYKKMYESVL